MLKKTKEKYYGHNDSISKKVLTLMYIVFVTQSALVVYRDKFQFIKNLKNPYILA